MPNTDEQSDFQDAATSRLIAQQQALFGGLHGYRNAQEADFRILDRAFHDAVRRDLAASGYRFVCDCVNVTASNTWPRNHAVLRCFLGDDGITAAAANHVKLFGAVRVLQWIGVLPRTFKVLDCETELSDGTFVTTSNAQTKTLGYPFIDRVQCPAKAPVAEIVQDHRAHLRSVLKARPGVIPVLCATYDELRASQDRLQLLKSAYRHSPEFDHRAEWEQIAGRPLRANERAMADQLAAEMTKPITGQTHSD